MSELVGLAPGAESRRRGQQRERGNENAETGAERIEPGEIRDERRREEDRADHVRESGRPRVLERPLTDQRLHEFEIREAGQAVAPPERQPDDELQSQQTEEPGQPGDDRDERERSDDDLVEARRARVDHVEIAVRISESHSLSLHFGKYCTV